MPDLTTIIAALAGIKNATDIVVMLRNIDKDFKKAELKLKMSEIADLLFDAKIALNSIQDELVNKDKEIERLKDALVDKDEILPHGDAYYKKDVNDNPIGYPYCSCCWETNSKKVRLVLVTGRGDSVCPNCRFEYRFHRTL